MISMYTMVHFAIPLWGCLCGMAALVAFPAYHLAVWRWKARRLLEMELRLDAAWQNTRTALAFALAGSRTSRVLSERNRIKSAESVQQRRVSCDI
jgi:hypothetical protein